jgi:hypothetical protein
MRALAVFLGLALLVLAAAPSEAADRPSPVRVLVSAEVAAESRDAMPTGTWTRLVADWVNARVIPFTGRPTLEDCKRAHAAFTLYARFWVVPRLPGSPTPIDRLLGRTHAVAVNCAKGTTVLDRTIDLSSDPNKTWDTIARAALAAHPVPISTVRRSAFHFF